MNLFRFILKFLRLVFLDVALLTFSLCATGQTNNHSQSVDDIISKMTIEQKVGQLFIVGFPQSRIDDSLQKFLSSTKVGSFILFKRNIVDLEQIQSLVKSLHNQSLAQSGIVPFIAVDQEGGLVSRLPIQPPPPNALALGSTGSAEVAHRFGKIIGKILTKIGFNMNLAPVLDLADPNLPTMIGVRSLGKEVSRVSTVGERISRGLLDSGVIPTAKHFPGMGSINLDPHIQKVSYPFSLDYILNNDIRAYSDFSQLGNTTAIMMSHLSYPSLDSSGKTALFSEKIMGDILRDQLQFKGIIITDDLMMAGTSKQWKPEVASLASLKAGADIVMMTWSFRDQERSIKYVLKAVENGYLPVKDLDSKLRRIVSAKLFLKSFEIEDGESAEMPRIKKEEIISSQMAKLDEDVLDFNLSRQSVSLAKFRNASSVCVFSNQTSFLRELRGNTKDSKFRFFGVAQTLSPENIASFIKRTNCEGKIFAIHGSSMAKQINSLDNKTKSTLTVLNLSSPSLLQNRHVYAGIIDLYFAHKSVGRKLSEYLFKN